MRVSLAYFDSLTSIFLQASRYSGIDSRGSNDVYLTPCLPCSTASTPEEHNVVFWTRLTSNRCNQQPDSAFHHIRLLVGLCINDCLSN